MPCPQKTVLCSIQRNSVRPMLSGISSHSIDTCRKNKRGFQAIPRARGKHLFASPPDNPEDNEIEDDSVDEDYTISDKVWEEVEASAPSELTVMKEVCNYLCGSHFGYMYDKESVAITGARYTNLFGGFNSLAASPYLAFLLSL